MQSMTARVFIHPRCYDGPAQGALAAHLQGQGYDITKICVGPEDLRHRRELVRKIDEVGVVSTFERMDGTRFTHRMGQIAPAPEAA